MAQADEELTVAQRLGHLLDRGLLPAGGPAEAAERLIERLERPARIALLGLPGSGKSAILNLLTGSTLVPETLRLPTIIVQFGADERMLCTLADGKTQTVPGRDLNDVLTLNPALVVLEANLPALKVISLLEVSAGPMDADQRRAAVWASKRADILIWCTTSYLPKEQQIWESMTDVVKDNGFLFLTKVDLLGGRDAAQGMLERVEQRAGEEFRQVMSISAKQARAATPPGGPVDRDLFRDSGAAAVITTIKTRVQMARRADTDMAELLLARHVEAGGFVARRFADLEDIQPAEAPATPRPEWTPPPEAVTEAVAEPEPVVPEPDFVTEFVSESQPEPEPEIAPEPDVPAEPLPMAPPEPDLEPEVQPAPEIRPGRQPQPPNAPKVTARPDPEGDVRPDAGRKRFSDRIKQMPVPDDAAAQPQVPLRSTWKSKSETAAPAPPSRGQGFAAKSRAAPELQDDQVSAFAAEPAPVPPVPRPPLSEVLRRKPGTAAAEADPEVDGEDDAVIAAMLAAVEAVPDESPPDVPVESAGEDSGETSDKVLQEGSDEVPDDAPEEASEDAPEDAPEIVDRAERPMPTDSTPLAERSARTQLFGSRKPAGTPPAVSGAAGTRPAARTGEPVTRVRAPAPRPPEAPRPDVPLPEALATPRFIAMRERPADGQVADSGPQRGDRRERTRIAARAVPSAATPLAPVAGMAPVAAADLDVVGQAIGVIVARSTELAKTVEPSAKVPVDMVLEHCRDTTEQVIDIISRARSADLKRIKIDLSEVQDLILLMLLEKGHAPADDALTMLLQIRRDLETLRSV